MDHANNFLVPIWPDLLKQIQLPAYIIDLEALQQNLQRVQKLRTTQTAKVLLALKGFATFAAFDYMRPFLDGTCASGVFEARLGAEEFGGEVHVYSPAFSRDAIEQIRPLAGHVSFNSISQFERFAPNLAENCSCGIRLNPQYSEIKTEMYDPCRKGSRLGITPDQLGSWHHPLLKGVHIHVLCQQFHDTLARVIAAVEDKFSALLRRVEWVNFGGGHFFSHPDYDPEATLHILAEFKKKYNVQLYIEPAEGLTLQCGWLASEVIDIIPATPPVAIMDCSASAHMPDVLEMPYLPSIYGARTEPATDSEPGSYAIGGQTCLAGDQFGNYRFASALQPGDVLFFEDMAPYTMVKTNTFNGVALPGIYLYHRGEQRIEKVKTFGYEDFKMRLS